MDLTWERATPSSPIRMATFRLISGLNSPELVGGATAFARARGTGCGLLLGVGPSAAFGVLLIYASAPKNVAPDPELSKSRDFVAILGF